MTKDTNRRDFVKSTAALGVGAWVAGGVSMKPSLSANEEIRFGCIGVGGKGTSDSSNAGKAGKVVAMCDIDDETLGKKKGEFPDAETFNDFREMLDKMGDKLDAVTVSIPDHTHAVAALRAMRMGKHIYCQKPLTHSIEEARLMGEVAKSTGVVTQMGNQGTSASNLRESAALIRKGIVGDVKEVHVWTNRPVWPQSLGLKVKEGPDPGEEKKMAWDERRKMVHWDNWIGPAVKRPYSPEIHPFKWRGFWEFGTGALGDMACHTLNMSYMALDLKFPTSVVAECDEHDGNCFPASSRIVFEFPELNGRPALKMIWYDGGRLPPSELMDDLPKRMVRGRMRHYDSAALIVGEKGNYYSPGDYGNTPRDTGLIVDGEFTRQRTIVRPADEGQSSPFSEFKGVEFVKSPGQFEEFAAAISGNGSTVSEFVNYAGPLTETILLGNLALWSGKKVNWDAKKMVAAGADESTKKMVRQDYHNGYSIHETVGING